MLHTEDMTETPLTETLEVGTDIEWQTWTGEFARATITHIDRLDSGTIIRISTDSAGVYFEATCFSTIEQAIPRTLRIAA